MRKTTAKMGGKAFKIFAAACVNLHKTRVGKHLEDHAFILVR